MSQVSVTPSQKKSNFMASITNCKSLSETPARQGVGHLGKQRLAAWFASTQSKEANDVGLKINLATHQPMRPLRINREDASQQVSFSMFRSTAHKHKDDATMPVISRVGLKVELPPLWEGSACGGSLCPHKVAHT